MRSNLHKKVALVLLLVAASIFFYKVFFLGYTFSAVIPEESYYLDYLIELTGHDSPVTVKLALPVDNYRQRVLEEKVGSSELDFTLDEKDGNKFGLWKAANISGKKHITYSMSVITKFREFVVPPDIPKNQEIADSVASYLLPEEFIQSDDSLIKVLSVRMGLDTSKYLLPALQKLYHYVADTLTYVNYKGTTDALTTLKLGEASCGGKSRLLVALARNNGIPARVVGGKILKTGRNSISHIWTEVWVNGFWVPICPTNHYFAQIPADYLLIYYGDQTLVTHTKDINFKFNFFVKKRLISQRESRQAFQLQAGSVVDIWETFKKISVSLELLKIIMMLPLGALVVVIFRNIIGLETFGLFMPALIAVGYRDIGLLWGLILFGLLIALGSLVRWSLDKLQLMHTPRLAIILTSVIIFLLGIATFGAQIGYLDLARVTLFPMVIMTLTVERLTIMVQEKSLLAALQVAGNTALVSACAYLAMETHALQSIVIGFPEVLLVIIVANLYLGRWTGFRVMEYLRFKGFLLGGPESR
jgi:transglutaminase-like putative cysteine protease